MVEESYLSIAVRAYTVRGGDDAEPLDTAKRGRRSMHDPRHVLVFDTETTTDLSQRLNFGCWRYYRVDWAHGVPSMSCVEEGFFYADDLPTRDPEGFEQLTKFVESHGPDVARRVPDAAWRLRLVSAREFVDEVLIPVAYRRRAWVVGFNLSFDLSRLAYGWGLARGRSAGGISLQLAQYDAAGGVRRENRFKPRVAIQTIDSKRQLIGFTRPSDVDLVDELPDDPGPDEDERQTFRGHFLDLRTLAFALTNEGYTLDSACRDFGVEFGKQEAEQHGEITESYLAYNRADVCATAGLFERLMTEFKHHPIGLQATKAFSPASVGKAYLRAMGITPILKREPQVPPAVLGKGMVAYYGGRAECRIRRTPVPVAYCDFLSMYPTVCCLMGLWKLVTAQSIQPVEQDPGEIQAWIDRLSVEDCFNSATWKHFVGLVQVEARGEILPVRAQYTASPSWGIGVNPLTHEQEDLWFTIPDLIAAKVLGGRAPRISKAMTLERVGRLPNLKPVALGGQITIDPRSRDFFQAVVEERHALKHRTDLPSAERDRLRAFLKVLANSSSYGIYAEMVRHHLRRDAKETVTVHGLDDKPFKDRVAHPESPGEFSFPPIAACITGAARLMLALTEKLVTDQGGGTYAFCDTDSMAIVATETGGPVTCPGGPHQTTDGREAIQALSWDQVENIRARFQGLNPYNRAVIPGSVLELEDQNYTDKAGKHRRQLYCFSISAKRYVLYEHAPNGQPVIRKEGEADGAGEKWSKHGLGTYSTPPTPKAQTATGSAKSGKPTSNKHSTSHTPNPRGSTGQPPEASPLQSPPRSSRSDTATRAGRTRSKLSRSTSCSQPISRCSGTHPTSTQPTSTSLRHGTATRATGLPRTGSTSTNPAANPSGSRQLRRSAAQGSPPLRPTATSSAPTASTPKQKASPRTGARAGGIRPGSCNADQSPPSPPPTSAKNPTDSTTPKPASSMTPTKSSPTTATADATRSVQSCYQSSRLGAASNYGISGSAAPPLARFATAATGRTRQPRNG